MLGLSGFDLYSRWVPLNVQGINSKNHLFWLSLHDKIWKSDRT